MRYATMAIVGMIAILTSLSTAFVLQFRGNSMIPQSPRRMSDISNTLRNSITSCEYRNMLELRESSLDSDAFAPGIDNAWRNVKKPLLRIGSKGVSPSHVRSLEELIAAHTCVKIKINTHKLGSLEEAFSCIQILVEQNSSTLKIELIHARKSDNTIMVGKEGVLDVIRSGKYPPPISDEDDRIGTK